MNDEEGERCLTVIHREKALECRYQVTRDTVNEQGRQSFETERTELTKLKSGGLTYRYQSHSRSSWEVKGRLIETESKIEIGYDESSEGSGRCPDGNGGTIDCTRGDVIPHGLEPCTEKYL